MASNLEYSIFHDVFFPPEGTDKNSGSGALKLQEVIRFLPDPKSPMEKNPLVVFDFETTGLDSDADQIIEIGALKIENGNIVSEFSSLVFPKMVLSDEVIKLTGITNEMLEGQPDIASVLPEFLEFISGNILVAHNAEFDMAFLRRACARLGIQLDWPAFCTLKMARQILSELPSKNLDTLAEHYQLTFESRHRSIGDCKVTAAVMSEMQSEVELMTWQDYSEYAVTKS